MKHHETWGKVVEQNSLFAAIAASLWRETPKSAAPAATPVVTAEVAAPVRADGQSGAVTNGERRWEFV